MADRCKSKQRKRTIASGCNKIAAILSDASVLFSGKIAAYTQPGQTGQTGQRRQPSLTPNTCAATCLHKRDGENADNSNGESERHLQRERRADRVRVGQLRRHRAELGRFLRGVAVRHDAKRYRRACFRHFMGRTWKKTNAAAEGRRLSAKQKKRRCAASRTNKGYHDFCTSAGLRCCTSQPWSVGFWARGRSYSTSLFSLNLALPGRMSIVSHRHRRASPEQCQRDEQALGRPGPRKRAERRGAPARDGQGQDGGVAPADFRVRWSSRSGK